MPSDTPQPGWTYQPSGASQGEKRPVITAHPEDQAPPSPPADNKISWTASEFIAHQKAATWYLLFLVGIAVIAGLIYVTTKDFISTFVIGFAGLLFTVVASHKPRQLPYAIDESGVHIGGKFYSFNQFKSFDLRRHGAIGNIELLPLKRFMPELSVYYPPEQEEKIVSVLSDHLPLEPRTEHQVDRLLKKMRF